MDIPELEPDPVLLAQLSQLSAASAPPRGSGPVRSLVAAVTVAVVGGFSWLTGTLPGVASPFHHEPADHAPLHAPAEPGQGDSDGTGPSVTSPGGTLTGRGDARGHGRSEQAPGQQSGQADEAPDTDSSDGDQAHQDNGNHYGQTKPHQNNGNHYGQTTPHQNNGNHTGQTKPHEDNGNANDQAEAQQDSGSHAGQTKPQQHGNGNGPVK